MEEEQVKKKFQLIEDIGDIKKGVIIESNSKNSLNYIEILYKGAIIIIPEKSELLEEVKNKLLFYTNEDLVYWQAEKLPAYIEDDLWYIYSIDNGIILIQKTECNTFGNLPNKYKYFKSKKAAEDYLILQQAIKDSKLTLKSRGVFHNKKFWNTNLELRNSFSDMGHNYVRGFYFYRETPCVVVSTENNLYTYYLPLDQFKSE